METPVQQNGACFSRMLPSEVKPIILWRSLELLHNFDKHDCLCLDQDPAYNASHSFPRSWVSECDIRVYEYSPTHLKPILSACPMCFLLSL